MKKLITGAVLSLVGSHLASAILISAGNNLVSPWDGMIGRLMSTVIEMKMIFPFILCVLCVAFGIIMMLVECFRKDK